ncbi:MAG: toxin-antitoxin system YwqK family antitoxin [Bacteroidales bacterium]|nr:toxin-antitoxin system YwqK family antitoxin [Bacteroidales bacterium]
MFKPIISLLVLICILFFIPAVYGQNPIDPNGYNIFYYPNGVKSSEGNMRNGQPDGYWKTYHENGILKSEGNREEFLLDSTWKFYDESGKIVLLINYKAGQKEGKRITYREGETIEEVFAKDIKQGMTTYYYPDGSVFRTINFVDGLEDGLAKEFGEDGRVALLTTYRKGFLVSRERINRLDGENRKQGNWKFFHGNGLVQLEGRYLNDQKNGYFKEYDQNGKLITASKWLDGEKQEDVEELAKLEVIRDYYPDGKVMIFQTFKNGVPHGIRREFSQDGEITAGSIYENGKRVAEGITGQDGVRNGPWKDFYTTGQLRAEGVYLDGQRVGKWTFYHLNGAKEQTGEFDPQGRPVGKWVWYYPSGNLLREENYIKGKADGMMSEYTEEGDILAEGDFIDGEEEGPWIYDLGNFREEGGYSYGLRHGVWRHYYDDGKLKFEGEFIDGKPVGKHVYYWDNGNIKDEVTYEMGIRQGDARSYNYDGTLLIIITYENGVEVKYDGLKIEPIVMDENE